jgi:terminase large subunit-like protein
MWGRLKKAIPTRWLDGRPNETSCVMRLRSGHAIRIVGLDAFENLRGSGLWFFGGDEWADCRPEAWTEVLRPMLSTSRGHALFIGTPKGFDHFRDAYLLGQAGGDPSYRSFLFTTLDGGNVPEDEIVAAQQQLDPRTFRQEYIASFESYAGRVVYAFSRAESVRASGYDAFRPLHVGMDFNINPMSATVWQEDGETTRQIDEIVMPTSNTDEMAAEIARRYGRSGFDPTVISVDHITIYPDPAGAQRRTSAAGKTDIGILREAGFRVVAMTAHPSVRDRTNVVNRQFLSADGIRRAFVDPSCRKSIEAYERLTYRDGSNEPDKSHGHDHLVDATGYYLFGRTLRQAGARASTTHIMER